MEKSKTNEEEQDKQKIKEIVQDCKIVVPSGVLVCTTDVPNVVVFKRNGMKHVLYLRWVHDATKKIKRGIISVRDLEVAFDGSIPEKACFSFEDL